MGLQRRTILPVPSRVGCSGACLPAWPTNDPPFYRGAPLLLCLSGLLLLCCYFGFSFFGILLCSAVLRPACANSALAPAVRRLCLLCCMGLAKK